MSKGNQPTPPSNVVNFNKARKKQKRAQKAEHAAQNRVKFGQTKAERSLSTAKTEGAARKLDQHLLDKEDEKS